MIINYDRSRVTVSDKGNRQQEERVDGKGKK